MNAKTKPAKPKGRKPHSKTNQTATVRFETPEQYQQVATYARDVKGVSVNKFCTSLILGAIKPRENAYEFINAEFQNFYLKIVYKKRDEEDILHHHHSEKLYSPTDGDIRRIVKSTLCLTAEDAKTVKIFRLPKSGET